MTVNPIHHKHFVSRKGEVIQQITNECGGTVTISFPRPNNDSDKVSRNLARHPIHDAHFFCVEKRKTVDARLQILFLSTGDVKGF